MESVDAKPTNTPSEVSSEDLKNWVQRTLDRFIDEYVWARGSDVTVITVQECEEVVTTPLQLILPDGTHVVVHVQLKKTSRVQQAEFDRIKHYAHIVLELGLLYMNFLDIIKVPDRNRLLTK
jgi:energy-converting hydrogenase A subunit M